jgi:hypothetical protein
LAGQRILIEMPYREIAWNGIRFEVPTDWEITGIGLRYLFFEDAVGPVFEVKWERIRGRFSHNKHMRRLAAQQRRSHGKAFQKSPLPKKWKKAVSAFDAAGFRWQGGPYEGIGAVLHCPECRNATLIQFFKKNGEGIDSRCLKILSSFRDHRTGKPTSWAVYDIQAETPPEFQLVKYRFDAGAFQMIFKAGDIKAALHRWSPAAVLLRNRSLEAFAAGVFRLPPVDPVSIDIDGSDGFQWVSVPAGNPLTRLVNRIRPAVPFRCIRIWHVVSSNRILGIAMEGRKPGAADLMGDLSAGFKND